MTRRTLWRAVQVLLAVALIGFVARDLARNWSEVVAARPQWNIEILPLGAALVVTWMAYGGLIWAWRSLLSGWGKPLAPLAAARVWAVASLGRYVPGKVWTVAGMVALSKRLGIPVWMSTAAAIVLQLLAIATGIVVVGFTAGPLLDTLDPAIRTAGSVLAVVVTTLTIAMLIPGVTKWVARVVPAMWGSPPRPGPLLFAVVINLAAWVCYGFAFWLVNRGVLATPGLTVQLAIASYTASYLVGFVAAFAPGGIGVRECIIIVLLRDALGIGPAAALAVASRFFITIVELGFVVPFLFLRPPPEPASDRMPAETK